ncbi:nucleoside hydrolase [Lacticaseibacillus baoqingensis]|uniref:Nucleoside hydrolase n=1 Tax=Lacticaseibacillus baoqingensis TaxID=2486013 RepID=A0ABW4E6I0_9LACO|nr:nucleoside hydrolase [Lacticaseibacillus baoqingensis]
MKPVIISTDPGIDDAVAIALAIASPQLEVRLICPLAGNVDRDKTTANTLKLLTFFKAEIPVVPGSQRPLLRAPSAAAEIHGESGMDGFAFPQPTQVADLRQTAVAAMHQVVSTSDQPVTLIAIGPLTDIALFAHLYPADLANVAELVIMGGALGRGNLGVLSEFNFACDPQAAAMVAKLPIPMRIAPLEVGQQARLLPGTLMQIKALGAVGAMFDGLFRHYRGGSMQTGLKMYDALAVALVLAPELFTTVATHLDVALADPLTAGASLFDLKGVQNQPANVQVATAVDAEGFARWLVAALKQLA